MIGQEMYRGNDLMSDVTGITAKDLMVEAVVTSMYAYEQQMVKLVDGDHTQDAYSVVDYLAHEGKVVKFEQYEKLNRRIFMTGNKIAERLEHFGPITCHLFKSPKEARSFSLHTDPDTVVLFMVEGRKIIESPTVSFTLNAGDYLIIPAGVKHRADNIEDSLMLSFGLEFFIAEKL